jgi:hypothetical protein
VATRNSNPGDAFQVFLLPPELTKKLDAHCRATGEAPDDVVRDALALHLDELGDLFDDQGGVLLELLGTVTLP